jgi:hypothetical protein
VTHAGRLVLIPTRPQRLDVTIFSVPAVECVPSRWDCAAMRSSDVNPTPEVVAARCDVEIAPVVGRGVGSEDGIA